jgi:hypothetical protein
MNSEEGDLQHNLKTSHSSAPEQNFPPLLWIEITYHQGVGIRQHMSVLDPAENPCASVDWSPGGAQTAISTPEEVVMTPGRWLLQGHLLQAEMRAHDQFLQTAPMMIFTLPRWESLSRPTESPLPRVASQTPPFPPQHMHQDRPRSALKYR